ncbi:AMP-binding protein [Henriciella aquimarina]|uniref:AMP-binding protein n=1 Tax=Henriciella aquimarina TaxID=545261 RepID=UPI000A01F262|nr:AMP-binding protein [Henriciella aquimarina]
MSTIPAPLTYQPKRTHIDIFSAILRAEKEFGGSKVAIVDGDEREFTYKEIIRASFALGSKLKSMTKRNEVVGIMLPTGAGAVIAFLSVLAAGRTPAMLNFTAGAANLKAAMRAASISKVLTAHRFVELGNLQPLMDELGDQADMVYLEDVREKLGLSDKLAGALGPIFPRLFHASPDYRKQGVILFTSGTEGEPKGVALSHQNIVANIEQVRAHIGLNPQEDAVFNPLPTFHCFGLTVGALLPMVAGVKAVFHPTPLQPREIAKRIRETRSTILLATDTFISQYTRAGDEGDMDTIRLAVCGAERVRDETRQLVRRKFDIEIVEGYGVTEASPVVAANSVEMNKPGTVGHLMADMEYELVPVEGIEDGGRLRVRGPNVMMGYIRTDNPGVIEPTDNGWHDTGDIVAVDEDDCLWIRGRVKRFAKIGGEMVSLSVVENCASAIWPDDMHAAAAIPDPRKGEQVILLTTAEKADRSAILAWSQSHGVSELSIPRKVYHVDEIPVLGTGKIDYGAVNKLVQQLANA